MVRDALVLAPPLVGGGGSGGGSRLALPKPRLLSILVGVEESGPRRRARALRRPWEEWSRLGWTTTRYTHQAVGKEQVPNAKHS